MLIQNSSINSLFKFQFNRDFEFYLTFSHDGVTVFQRCKPGFKTKWGHTGIELKCTEGVWHVTNSFLTPDNLHCLPVCAKPCLNGGWCNAPENCLCTEGFTGDQCQFRKSKRSLKNTFFLFEQKRI